MPFGSVRGSMTPAVFGAPTLERKGDDGVTIKGLYLDFQWYGVDITDSPTPIADDLMKQVKKDLETLIAGGTKSKLIKDGSQSTVVLTDMTTYASWSEWGHFSPCNDDTCTYTRKMKCSNPKWPDSQIPCDDPNPDNAPTETEACTSNKCGKYNG